MSLTKFIFKQVDYWFYFPQNSYSDKNAIRIAKNLVYCDKNPKLCNLDIYCTKGKEKVVQPIFVNIHGGGFVAGDKKYRKSFSKYCTKFDVKVLNVNYSLAPKFTLPDIIEQLKQLWEWIENNAKKYFLNTNKVILCGDSAGAYFAMWLWALANKNLPEIIKNLAKIDTKIIGLALFSGIYFPTQSLSKHMLFNINHSLWEYLCGEKFIDIESCKKHKLYNLIDIGNFVDCNLPPVFVSHSESDIFCGDNGKMLISKLQEHSIPYYEVCSKNNIHDWQEVMFTKSAKLTLAKFDKFMYDILNDNVSKENNSIVIARGKILQNN